MFSSQLLDKTPLLIKKDWAITFYSLSFIIGLVGYYFQVTNRLIVSIIIGLLFIAFTIDINKIYTKYIIHKNNIFITIPIKLIKYVSFVMVSLIVIKTTNAALYDLLMEDPRNYPATLASFAIIMTPIIWFAFLLGTTMVGSLIATMLIPIYLWMASYFHTKFSIVSSIIRLIALIAIVGFLQGIYGVIMPLYNKVLVKTVIDTAFYKNISHCHNIDQDKMIAFTDRSEEVLLLDSYDTKKIYFTKIECMR